MSNFEPDKIEIENISVFITNLHLVKIIRQYCQNFAFYRASHLVSTLNVSKLHQDDIVKTWVKRMGPYIYSPRITSHILSKIYCHVFNKDMPFVVQKDRKPEPYPCMEDHGYFYPADGRKRQGRFIYCDECSRHQHMPGHSGYVNVEKSPDWVFGQKEEPTYRVPCPTKAFKHLSVHDSATLLTTARDIFDLFKV